MPNRMYKKGLYTIIENRPLTAAVWRMVLAGDTQYIVRPGQFIDIAIDGLFLRRPISVCDWDDSTVTIIYKIVGKGTEAMSHMAPGSVLEWLYNLCKRLTAEGRRPTVVMGFSTAGEIFYREEFEKLGVDVHVATADGSLGVRGLVTDAIDAAAAGFDYIYACGPVPMLRALYDRYDVPGQFSFEERMGCGFGACMGCSCKTKYGNKRICVDGPVLKREEIIW